MGGKKEMTQARAEGREEERGKATAAAAPAPAIATFLSLYYGFVRAVATNYGICIPDAYPPTRMPRRRGSHAGTPLEEAVPAGEGRSRIDTWISAMLGGGGVSRARIQVSIAPASSLSMAVPSVRFHIVSCTVSELQPLRAEPEDIPLDIVCEDEHLLVVNKPAHMIQASSFRKDP
ncbi:hypothetical protein ABZP36_011693 [Zizania latifolia]